MCGHVHLSTGTHGGQRGSWIPWRAMWVLETKLRLSVRAGELLTSESSLQPQG